MRATALRLALCFALGASLTLPALPAGAETAQDPELQEWTVPDAASRPRDPMVGPDGDVWFVGQVSDYVARLDPEPGTFERYPLPEGAGPHNLIVDPSGIVWYAGNRDRHVGRLDPATDEVTEWMLPSGENARPYAMAVDDNDRIWVVETGVQPNRFVGFDPRTESFTSVPVESGGGSVRHMYFDAETNSIWFGADTNTVGVARLPPARPVSD